MAGRARGLTKERWRAALCAHLRTGIYARTAAAIGVTYETLRTWRRECPEFEAELQAVDRQVDERIGHLGRAALEQELEDYVSRRPLVEEQSDGQGGKVALQKDRTLNVAAARTALTKLNREWTHPKTEVEHSGTLTVEQAVAEAASRLDDAG